MLKVIADGRASLRERVAHLRDNQRTPAVKELAARLHTDGDAVEAAVRAVDIHTADKYRRLTFLLHDQVDPWRSQIAKFPPTIEVEEDR